MSWNTTEALDRGGLARPHWLCCAPERSQGTALSRHFAHRCWNFDLSCARVDCRFKWYWRAERLPETQLKDGRRLHQMRHPMRLSIPLDNAGVGRRTRRGRARYEISLRGKWHTSRGDSEFPIWCPASFSCRDIEPISQSCRPTLCPLFRDALPHGCGVAPESFSKREIV